MVGGGEGGGDTMGGGGGGGVGTRGTDPYMNDLLGGITYPTRPKVGEKGDFAKNLYRIKSIYIFHHVPNKNR